MNFGDCPPGVCLWVQATHQENRDEATLKEIKIRNKFGGFSFQISKELCWSNEERKGHFITWRELSPEMEQTWHPCSDRCINDEKIKKNVFDNVPSYGT